VRSSEIDIDDGGDTMSYHFRNLVFEGGGVKGIAYVGALAVLEEQHILKDIQRVGGTSAGAIVAALLALDYSVSEIKEILWSMDFKRFLDSTWGVIRNTERLLKEYGWYKGDYFKDWMEQLIEAKTGSRQTTFKELTLQHKSRPPYLIGTNLSTGYAEIFSHLHTPEMPIAEGVRISMSLPLFFTAVRLADNDVCVDGGVLENYPIKLFDRRGYIDNYFSYTEYYEKMNWTGGARAADPYVFNMETLGFRLDSSSEIQVFEKESAPASVDIDDFFTYLKRLVSVMLDSQQNRHLHSDDWQRTVYIDTLGVKTTDFDLSDEKKKALMASGRVGMERYLNWFNTSKERIANKPMEATDLID
jgi:NTE family protein